MWLLLWRTSAGVLRAVLLKLACTSCQLGVVVARSGSHTSSSKAKAGPCSSSDSDSRTVGPSSSLSMVIGIAMVGDASRAPSL